MIQFIAGMGVGISFCTVCWLVGSCIYIEKKHPEIPERICREQNGREAIV